MSIFGKKEKEAEEEGSFKQGRKITKNLKDLNPENKKKRKEPPKPWGKKERILVLVVLLATTVISGILLFSNSFKLGFGGVSIHPPKFNFDSINIFKGETIVIEKK